MTFRLSTSRTGMPAPTGWPAFAGMARVDVAAALITNQPRGY